MEMQVDSMPECTALIARDATSLANVLTRHFYYTRKIGIVEVLRGDISLVECPLFKSSLRKVDIALGNIFTGSIIVGDNENIHKEKTSTGESGYLVVYQSIDGLNRLRKSAQIIKAIAPECQTIGDIFDYPSIELIWQNEFGSVEYNGVYMRVCVLKNAQPVIALALNYVTGKITVTTEYGETEVYVQKEHKQIKHIDILNSKRGNFFHLIC